MMHAKRGAGYHKKLFSIASHRRGSNRHVIDIDANRLNLGSLQTLLCSGNSNRGTTTSTIFLGIGGNGIQILDAAARLASEIVAHGEPQKSQDARVLTVTRNRSASVHQPTVELRLHTGFDLDACTVIMAPHFRPFSTTHATRTRLLDTTKS